MVVLFSFGWKILLAISLLFSVTGCASTDILYSKSIEELQPYSGQPYTIVQENEPNFTEDEIVDESFKYFSPLDLLGRCGPAFSCVGRDLLANQERESISSIYPTGWQSVQYDCVEGKNLYNRCHLLAHSLSQENANEKNLITGTRYLNTEGMLPFEMDILDYVRESGHHVMYRVTPIFEGNNLVASGVEMEAYSVEDEGKGIKFHIYCYNVQPGVKIDYATGDSWLIDEKEKSTSTDHESKEEYIINIRNKKFHRPNCNSINEMADHNKKEVYETYDTLIEEGYSPCKNCFKN